MGVDWLISLLPCSRALSALQSVSLSLSPLPFWVNFAPRKPIWTQLYTKTLSANSCSRKGKYKCWIAKPGWDRVGSLSDIECPTIWPFISLYRRRTPPARNIASHGRTGDGGLTDASWFPIPRPCERTSLLTHALFQPFGNILVLHVPDGLFVCPSDIYTWRLGGIALYTGFTCLARRPATLVPWPYRTGHDMVLWPVPSKNWEF